MYYTLLLFPCYTDRHTIFVSPNKDKLSIEEQLEGKIVNQTQFERAMGELGITIINVRSPQAKGRIERLWETFQDRLKVEHANLFITELNVSTLS